MSTKAKKPRLGRGLSSLISMPVSLEPPDVEAEAVDSATSTVVADVETVVAPPPPVPAVAPAIKQPAVVTPPAPVAKARITPPAPPISAPKPGDEVRRIPAGIPSASSLTPNPQPQAPSSSSARELIWVAVDAIEPNPYQPRRTFDPAALDQLARSIKQDGVMQPIIIRPTPGSASRFQLVAGERRWRAAQIAGLAKVPAILRILTDEQIAEWGLIENLQREDLNPIERAEAFARLSRQFKLTHERIAERVGVDRVTITNLLRLLELQSDVQELVRLGTLSAGHGRALLAVTEHDAQLALAQRAVAGGWSVRMIEATVRRAVQPATAAQRKTDARSAVLEDLERQIAAQLSTKVAIKPARKKGAGTLMIDFYNLDQFDALMGKLGVHVEAQ